MIIFKPITNSISNGHRCSDNSSFTPEEIKKILMEAARIQINLYLLVFNDSDSTENPKTYYDFKKDRLFVAKNVLPDMHHSFSHPRDVMSIAAVLAREYYGHRLYRDEYVSDSKKSEAYHSIPHWQDECRASITAAKVTPNLSQLDRAYLLMDAFMLAEEAGYSIELDDYMKSVVFADYSIPDRAFNPNNFKIKFISNEDKDTITDKLV